MKAYLKHPIHFLSLGFGLGLLPKAPGTWGTLGGIPLYLILVSFSWPLYIMSTFLLFGFGVWVCQKSCDAFGVHDHPAVVFDEMVGYLVTMFALPYSVIWMVLGFIVFRFFDIWKPFPIRRLDKQCPGGLGVMIDDVVAGIYACVVLQIVAVMV